ncbi:hypothetical protein ABC345_01440 [Shouchella sp. 1P09AA]|uniref:hypothetical protein n=1 Tax=unclassified Shouchella TaxID=2893065 RepID=UPI0039A301AB
MVTSAVWETIGSRPNREFCDPQVGPGRVDETYTNVRKTGAAMRVIWGLQNVNSTSPQFYHS